MYRYNVDVTNYDWKGHSHIFMFLILDGFINANVWFLHQNSCYWWILTIIMKQVVGVCWADIRHFDMSMLHCMFDFFSKSVLPLESNLCPINLIMLVKLWVVGRYSCIGLWCVEQSQAKPLRSQFLLTQQTDWILDLEFTVGIVGRRFLQATWTSIVLALADGRTLSVKKANSMHVFTAYAAAASN